MKPSRVSHSHDSSSRNFCLCWRRTAPAGTRSGRSRVFFHPDRWSVVETGPIGPSVPSASLSSRDWSHYRFPRQGHPGSTARASSTSASRCSEHKSQTSSPRSRRSSSDGNWPSIWRKHGRPSRSMLRFMTMRKKRRWRGSLSFDGRLRNYCWWSGRGSGYWGCGHGYSRDDPSLARISQRLHVPQHFLGAFEPADRIDEVASRRSFGLGDRARVVDHIDAHRRWLDGTN